MLVFRNGRHKRLVGYREKEKAGYIRHDVKTLKDGEGEEFAATQMLFTAKGIAQIAMEMATEKLVKGPNLDGDLFSGPHQRIDSPTPAQIQYFHDTVQ